MLGRGRFSRIFLCVVIFLLSSFITGCFPKPTPTPTPTPVPGELFLEVLSPADESVVETGEIVVEGRTLPTAVISVNGILVPVNADGSFSTKITLEEGPNLIEVVVSDVSGSQISKVLTVIYTGAS